MVIERVRVKLANFDSPENAKIVEELTERFRWLLPFWLRNLRIEQRGAIGDDGTTAIMTVQRRYHDATMGLAHNFHDADDTDRAWYFVHELMHTHMDALTSWMIHEVIDPIKDRNEELHTHLTSEFTAHFEEVVDGLARAVLDHEKVDTEGA